MKLNKTTVLVIVIAVVILAAGGIYYGMQLNEKKSSKQVADKTIEFINSNLLQPGTTASLTSMTEENGLYELKIKVGTAEPEVYVTKNGKLLFIQGVIDMSPASTSTSTANQTQNNNTPKDTCETLTKAKNPALEAFVVSSCPFGLQMQRVLSEIVKNIPSLASDIKVEYIGAVTDNKITSMHGDAEAQENLRQICIREEQASKYWNYVGCYIKAGDSASCLTSSGVDKTKLNSCVSDSSKGLKYAQADFAGAAQYGVSGSPTLILNGKKVSEFDFGGRTAQAVKTLLCCGAQTQPGVCSQTLSTTSAATSFSTTYSGTAASNNSASCGQ